MSCNTLLFTILCHDDLSKDVCKFKSSLTFSLHVNDVIHVLLSKYCYKILVSIIFKVSFLTPDNKTSKT